MPLGLFLLNVKYSKCPKVLRNIVKNFSRAKFANVNLVSFCKHSSLVHAFRQFLFIERESLKSNDSQGER